jgi:hypothetical protein
MARSVSIGSLGFHNFQGGKLKAFENGIVTTQSLGEMQKLNHE